jgi:hypothetical protein
MTKEVVPDLPYDQELLVAIVALTPGARFDMSI